VAGTLAPNRHSTLDSPMPNIVRVTLLIMFVHLSLGAIMPYLPVWLGQTKGLSGAQIGIILASSSFGRIVVGPLAAAWAEGRKDSRTPLIVFSLCVALGYVVYPFVGPFWPIALACFATGIAGQCLVASSEATTLKATSHSQVWPYGRARAMASTGFAIASLGAGAIIQSFGINGIYVWFVVATFGTFLCTLWLLPDPIIVNERQPLRHRLKGGLALFAKPRFLACVVAAGLIQSAHAFYYGFVAGTRLHGHASWFALDLRRGGGSAIFGVRCSAFDPHPPGDYDPDRRTWQHGALGGDEFWFWIGSGFPDPNPARSDICHHPHRLHALD
jgi:predicted MFS family arabinose efflux permease